MLVAVIVMSALVLIALAVAAPIMARELRRDKEIESMHRANEYVRAIQLYQRKFSGQYPASIKILENTNNIRFLRKQYVDPLTGKADWRLIHLGEQKTKIHVFFGKELGDAVAGLGSSAGTSAGLNAGAGSTGTAPTSSTSTVGANTALTSGFNDASITTTTGGTTGASSTSSGISGDSSLGVIVGVGPARTGSSVAQPNGQSTYESWEFWYDPRIELLRSGVSVTGGGMSSTSAGSFGQNAVTGQTNSGSGGSSNSFGGSSNSFGGSSNSFGGSSNSFGGSSGGFGTTGTSTSTAGGSSGNTSGSGSNSTSPSGGP